MNIKPLEDFIVVRPLEVKQGPAALKPRIHLTEKAKEAAGMFDICIAEVVEVGPGRCLESGERRTMDVKKKDRVIFSSKAPLFPLAETALWQANGKVLPPLALMNIGHLLGILDDSSVELSLADKFRIGSDD